MNKLELATAVDTPRTMGDEVERLVRGFEAYAERSGQRIVELRVSGCGADVHVTAKFEKEEMVDGRVGAARCAAPDAANISSGMHVPVEMDAHLEEQMIDVTPESSPPLAEDVLQDHEQQDIQQQTVTPAEPRVTRPLVQDRNPNAKFDCLLRLARQIRENVTKLAAANHSLIELELKTRQETTLRAIESHEECAKGVQQLQAKIVEAIAEIDTPEPQVAHPRVEGANSEFKRNALISIGAQIVENEKTTLREVTEGNKIEADISDKRNARTTAAHADRCQSIAEMQKEILAQLKDIP